MTSRSASGLKDLPSEVKGVQVDYSSQESLTTALRGHDVAIVTFGFEGLQYQGTIIEAAVEAGVKRLIPCDWGSLTTDPAAASLSINAFFVQVHEALRAKAAAGQLEWTIFSVGPFLEYVTDSPFVVDAANRSVTLYDEGQHRFSATSLPTIGKAVARALRKPNETRNRNVLVHDIVLTQRKVLDLAKKYTPGAEWKETRVDPAAELERTLQAAAANPGDQGALLATLQPAILGGRFRAAYPNDDNKLLGIPFLPDEEFEKKVAAAFQKA